MDIRCAHKHTHTCARARARMYVYVLECWVKFLFKQTMDNKRNALQKENCKSMLPITFNIIIILHTCHILW